ncbi:MAG: hypothetical protein N3A38_03795 [Planctomycetota bacterium]|nr:hypothetical protein [Planctomycetota bacterium]
MSDQLQVTVLLVGFAAGFTAWWFGLRGVLRLRTMSRSETSGVSAAPTDAGLPGEQPCAPEFSGEGARIEGCVGVAKGTDRSAYLNGLAGLLENPIPVLGGPLLVAAGFGPAIGVRERTTSGLSFVNTRPSRLGLPFAFEDGRVEILPPADAGMHSFRVRYELNVSSAVRRWTAWLLIFVVFVELPVLIVLPSGLGWFCIGNPDPAVRYQVFQVAQICHVLWPPFFFLYLVKRTLRGTGAMFEAFLKVATVKAAGAGDRR